MSKLIGFCVCKQGGEYLCISGFQIDFKVLNLKGQNPLNASNSEKPS